MAKTKKILLFVVEGDNDATALAATMMRIFSTERVQFCIMNGDITSSNKINPNNIKKALCCEIKRYIEDILHVNKKDILRVIHLVDTDGAFIEPKFVLLDENLGKNCKIYTTTGINANNPEGIINRNRDKAKILRILKDMNIIWGNVQYKIYYFSCNLDHFFCGNPNPSMKNKKENASSIDKKYSENIPLFISDIRDPRFAAKGNYHQTWDEIQTDLNSLSRRSNFHLLFDNFKM